MALSAKLQLRQSQSLVMTPQLMQSIKLLQFTHLELERLDPQEDAATDQLQKEREGDGSDEAWYEAATPASSQAIADQLDTTLENVFPDDPGSVQRVGPDLAAQWKSAPGGSSGGDGE